MGIVSRDLAFCLFNFLLVSVTGFSDLPAPSVFAALMVFFGSSELLPGHLEGVVVVLLTAEYTAEPSYRFRFEVGPPGSRIGDCEFAQVKWWHSNTAPE
jgi:hypothetical protein